MNFIIQGHNEKTKTFENSYRVDRLVVVAEVHTQRHNQMRMSLNQHRLHTKKKYTNKIRNQKQHVNLISHRKKHLKWEKNHRMNNKTIANALY